MACRGACNGSAFAAGEAPGAALVTGPTALLAKEEPLAIRALDLDKIPVGLRYVYQRAEIFLPKPGAKQK